MHSLYHRCADISTRVMLITTMASQIICYMVSCRSNMKQDRDSPFAIVLSFFVAYSFSAYSYLHLYYILLDYYISTD